MFRDVIREAKSEYEIYFLLTSYIEAVRFGDQLNVVPESVKDLPLDGGRVKQQYQKLVELDRHAAGNAKAVIDEALPIFKSALDRLEALSGERRPAGYA